MILNCLFVGIGGFIGSVFRYLMSQIPALNSKVLPYQTLLANVLGAVIIGMIIKYSGDHSNMNPHMLLLLKVGICGGFTTFSTFSAESLGFFESGKYGLGITYVVLSVVLCILGVFIGKQLI